MALSEDAREQIEAVRQGRSGSIRLVHEDLGSVPSEIRDLQHLEELFLYHCGIKSVPDWVGELPSLNRLALIGNPLEHVPDNPGLILDWPSFLGCDQSVSLGNILGLQVGVDGNGTVPESEMLLPAIRGLTGLRELDIWGVDLIPSGAILELIQALGDLHNLEVLGIEGFKLGEVPNGIRKLQRLRTLQIVMAELRALPDWVRELRNLETIDLQFNDLTSVPAALAELPLLRTILLFENPFQQIPVTLFQIPSLTRLHLGTADGQLTEIPPAILDATNLQLLNLRGHQIRTPPPEVVDKGVDAIKNYWRQREEAGVDYLCEAKLILVGEGGAGKTSLARKIKDQAYQLKPSEPTTEGIEIVHWDFQAAVRTKDKQQILNRNFHVNTWDFGGQEIYHATHQFFLTRRSLYLLVADDRKEDTDFNYWLDVVGLLSDRSPLLIVQNEKQDRQRDINIGNLRARFPNIRGDYRVNLNDNRGLDALVSAIRRELEALPHIGVALPATWRRVRERLEGDDRNHITLGQYVTLCEENGFKRREDSLQVSGYLHDLGVCVHFQDDPVLKHIVILKPKWGTDAVYRVLDDKQVFANHGQFTKDDLARIWNEPGYVQMRQELLRLMMKFQLCYELAEGGAYIAPQLLSSSQPAYPWEPKGNLVLRYQYDFMPKGLVSRLIVALHHLIADQSQVWKSGVILHREGSKAEIIEDRQRNRITVRAVGPDTRGLIAVIDDQLERIHSSFPSVPFEKHLSCNCPVCSGAAEPFAYPLKNLKRFAQAGRPIQCQESFEMVGAAALVRDIFPAAVEPPPGARITPERVKEVYVSYAWTGESEAIVAQIKESVEKRGIHVLQDTNEVTYKDSIREFMQSMGTGKAIIVVLSKRYLESKNCMFELTEIADHKEFRERVFPIVLGDAKIHDAVNQIAYVEHWEAKIGELDAAMKKVRGDNLQGIREDLDLYAKIRATIAGLVATLSDMNTLTPEQHQGSNFEELYRLLDAQLNP
jgi:internalin A